MTVLRCSMEQIYVPGGVEVTVIMCKCVCIVVTKYLVTSTVGLRSQTHVLQVDRQLWWQPPLTWMYVGRRRHRCKLAPILMEDIRHRQQILRLQRIFKFYKKSEIFPKFQEFSQNQFQGSFLLLLMKIIKFM